MVPSCGSLHTRSEHRLTPLWLLAAASMSNVDAEQAGYPHNVCIGNDYVVEIILVMLLAIALVYLTAVTFGNNLGWTLDEVPLPRDDGLPVIVQTDPASISNPSYTEFQSGQGATDFDGDVLELDDLVTEGADSEAASPPSPSGNPAGPSLPLWVGRQADSREPLQDVSVSRATSREFLQPPQSAISLFAPLHRRRANDTESRGSEVYRSDPYDPYYRRRAASVPALRSEIQDR